MPNNRPSMPFLAALLGLVLCLASFAGTALAAAAETPGEARAGIPTAELPITDARIPAEAMEAGRTLGVCPIDPEVLPMRATQNAPGSLAEMTLVQPHAAFGISVDAEGRQVYELEVRVTRLRRDAGRHYIVWAATPELDRHAKLGTLDESGRVQGSVHWNKFLVFVTAETDPEVERWEGPVLLRGISPSGRMHTMAGHGPFEGVNCQEIF